MQLAGSRTASMHLGAAARRSCQAVAVGRPAARCMRSIRPSRGHIRTFAAAESAEKTGRKQTLLKDVLDLVKAGGARLLDLADDAPKQVTTLNPEDTQLCLDYAIWAWSAYEQTTEGALKNLNAESTIKKKLIPSSLVILSGSSPLSERLVFRKIKTDTQALLGLQDDGKGGVELVVAFRGSEKKASDWITDFLVDMDPLQTLVPTETDKKLQVHAGFMESANDFLTDKTMLLYGPRDATDKDRKAFKKHANKEKLSDQELQIVQGDMNAVKTLKDLGEELAGRYRKRITKLVICGHSLGGALATLTSYWCRKYGWKNLPVEYYSYGSPRVANHEFAAEWGQTIIKGQANAKAFRVMHRYDLVAAIPRADLPIPMFSDSWYDRYIHVDGGVLLLQPGQDAMIGNQGTPDTWPQLAVDPAQGWQAQQRRRPFDPDNRSADDHSLNDTKKSPPEGYIPALRDALKNYTGKYEPLSG